ncbi:MAG TPA: aminodeoxychorismate synthase component I [Opitutaceae bacterium]|nr:aminodeoxychorismate synthase component I [Opitutaceae bacterium]
MAVTVRELGAGLIAERLFTAIAGRRGAFFLDSARAAGGLGRWSFLGCEPFLVFRETEAEGIVIEERGRAAERQAGDVFVRLRECLRRFPAAAHPEIPFTGGAIGFLSYELGAALERVQPRVPGDIGVPRACFGFYDGVIAHDHATGRTYAVANTVHERSAEQILAELEAVPAEAASGAAQPCPAPVGGADEPISNFTKPGYLERVQRVREYIAAGDVYQINLTQRFATEFRGDPYALYRRLRAATPAPFAAYLNGGDFQVLSSSPERFLRIAGREIETRPIKGTRPRGATPEEDALRKTELLASEKDRAELLMIVDLERNDLGRVCETGSVRVDELCRLETHPTVHHLVAAVRGRLRPECDALDAVRAAFPGGSITGAPKVRAMQLIDELETVRRGVYTGAIGWIGFDGDCDLNIAIRTIVCRGGRAYYHVGGGVVWDSDPESEFQETLDKGRALRAALVGANSTVSPSATFHRFAMRGDELVEAADLRVSPLGDGFMFAHGLFETVRALGGRPAFLDRHVARLQCGARRLGVELPTEVQEWRERLARLAHANGLGDGSFKLVRFRDVGATAEFAVARGGGYAAAQYARGFRVRLAPEPRAGGMHGVKSLAYLENLLARRAAQADGFDEVVFADAAGALLEGAATNVFAVVAGRVITSPLGAILPGVARGVVLEICGARAEEHPLTRELVAAAEELFLTNALLGVMPVAEFDGRRFDVGRASVTRELAAEFFRRQRESAGE